LQKLANAGVEARRDKAEDVQGCAKQSEEISVKLEIHLAQHGRAFLPVDR